MIQINEKVRISRIDKWCLQVEEYRLVVGKKTKEERYDWCWVGYYGSLKSAIGGVLNYCLMSLTDEEIKDCKALIEKIERLDKEIKEGIGKATI
jgi:hypothetical protein